jgi:hypothetical protein
MSTVSGVIVLKKSLKSPVLGSFCKLKDVRQDHYAIIKNSNKEGEEPYFSGVLVISGEHKSFRCSPDNIIPMKLFLKDGSDYYEICYRSYSIVLPNEFHRGVIRAFKNKVREGDAVKIIDMCCENCEGVVSKTPRNRDELYEVTSRESIYELRRSSFVLTDRSDVYEMVAIICPKCQANEKDYDRNRV